VKRCMVGQLRNLISPPVTCQGVDVLACEKLTYLFIRLDLILKIDLSCPFGQV